MTLKTKKVFSILLITFLVLSILPFSFVPEVFAVSWWENSCDSLDGWVLDTEEGVIEIDTSTKTEGTGSIYMEGNTTNNQNVIHYDVSSEVPVMANYSFWYGGQLRIHELSSSSSDMDEISFTLWASEWGHNIASVGVNKSDSGFKLVTLLGDPATDPENISTTEYSFDMWYKVDIYFNYTTTTFEVYVDDVLSVYDNETRSNFKPAYFELKTIVSSGLDYPNSANFDECYISGTRPIALVWNSDVTISNMEGCGNWVFSEEKYYSFEAQYGYWNASGNASTYIDTAKIAFYDGFHWMNATYDVQEGEFSIESGSDIITLKSGSVTESGFYLNVTFELYFKTKVLDTLDVDIYMYVNDTAGNEDTWEVQAEDYFNIYNLGGQAELTTTDYGGRSAGGEVFELWAGQEGYTDVWSEDFEDEDLSGWGLFTPNATLEGNTITNHDEQSVQVWPIISYYHDRSMRIYDSTSNYTAAWHKFTSQSGNIVFQIWVDTPTQSEALSIVLTNMVEGGAGGPWIMFDDDGYAYFNNSTGKFKIQEDQYAGDSQLWRNMTLDINITAQTYDIYWHEELKQSDVTFNNTRTTLDTLLLMTYVGNYPASETTKVYVDEIIITRPALGGGVNGTAVTTVTYRKLQHLHSLFAIGIPRDTDGLYHQGEGYVEWGIDVCFDDTWVENAWKVRISLEDADVKNTKFGTSGQNWIILRIEWFENDTTLIDTEFFYTFWEGGPGGLAGDYRQADYFRLYLDLWVNNINASTTVGGRVSSYYYGMSDRSDPWWYVITGTDWSVIGSERAQSMYFADLKDIDGNVRSSREAKLFRIRAKVYRSSNYDYMWRMEEFDLLNYKIAPGEMEGINTPTFTETAIPSMPAGGFLAALAVAFDNTMRAVVNMLGPQGLLGIIDILIGYMDTMSGAFGYPTLFSDVASLTAIFAESFTVSIGYLVDISVPLFTFIAATFSFIITTLAGVIDFIITLGGYIVDIINGTYSTMEGVTSAVSYILELFTVDGWPTLFSMVLVLFWFGSIDKRALEGKGWMTSFMGDIQAIISVLSFIFDLSYRFIMSFLRLIFWVIHSIPGI